MGLHFSSNKKLYDINHLTDVKNKCEINKSNQKILLKIFKNEFNILIKIWNDGKIHGYHFEPLTYVMKYIDDKQLFIIYNTFIQKWNSGILNSNDFNIITEYLNKFC